MDKASKRLIQVRLYQTFLKRPFDLAITIPAMLILAPVMAVVALLVRFKLGTPVFFRQQRPGLHGKPFMLIKFRTMTDQRDAEGNLLPDEVRLTAFGQFLRSTSLDELPELLNVLKGEMSLVGPRPLLMEYLDRYTPAQMRRHDAMPGITGWAQVNGRVALSFEERFDLDVWYVDHQSPWLDIKIILQTLQTIVKRENVSREGYATGPDFMGTPPRQ